MTDNQDFYANPDNYNIVYTGTIMKEEFKQKKGDTDNILVIKHYLKIIIGYKKFYNLQDAKNFTEKARKDFIEHADASFYILDLNKLEEL